jgi:hypothetical protein
MIPREPSMEPERFRNDRDVRRWYKIELEFVEYLRDMLRMGMYENILRLIDDPGQTLGLTGNGLLYEDGDDVLEVPFIETTIGQAYINDRELSERILRRRRRNRADLASRMFVGFCETELKRIERKIEDHWEREEAERARMARENLHRRGLNFTGP